MNKDENITEEMIEEQKVFSRETQLSEETEQETETQGADSEEFDDEEFDEEDFFSDLSQSKKKKKEEFSSLNSTAFSALANTEKLDEEYRHALTVRTITVMAVLTVAAAVLRFLNFTPPFLPSFLSIDFSAFPELLASLAYGPFFGILIVVIKNIIYAIIKYNSLSVSSIITNLVLNSLFITIAGIFYSKRMYYYNPKKPIKRDMRRIRIFGGGVLGAFAAAIASFPLAKFVTFPIMIKYYSSKGYSEKNIIYFYQYTLNIVNEMLPDKLQGIITDVGSLNRGIAFFNVPSTFLKFFISALFAVLVYNFVSPYMHFREKKNK